VFQKKELRKIFGSNGDEVTKNLRKLHGKELHKLKTYRNIARLTRLLTGHAARVGEIKN
jgi:hypothetical protein